MDFVAAVTHAAGDAWSVAWVNTARVLVLEAGVAVNASWVEIALPRGWRDFVKSAVLQVVSLARFAIIHARGWAADTTHARARLEAEIDQVRSEVSLLQEELRIKDARMVPRVPAEPGARRTNAE